MNTYLIVDESSTLHGGVSIERRRNGLHSPRLWLESNGRGAYTCMRVNFSSRSNHEYTSKDKQQRQKFWTCLQGAENGVFGADVFMYKHHLCRLAQSVLGIFLQLGNCETPSNNMDSIQCDGLYDEIDRRVSFLIVSAFKNVLLHKDYVFKGKFIMATVLCQVFDGESKNQQNPMPQFRCSLHFRTLPPSSECIDMVQILGRPRSYPYIKDSGWCIERKYIEEMKHNDALECILSSTTTTTTNNEVVLLEGLITNIFFINTKGHLFTAPATEQEQQLSSLLTSSNSPPLDHVLSGHMRECVINLCQNNDIKIIFRCVHINQLVDGDVVMAFLTSTTKLVSPIKKLLYKDKIFNLSTDVSHCIGGNLSSPNLAYNTFSKIKLLVNDAVKVGK